MITVHSIDNASPALADLAKKIKPQRLVPIIGPRLREVTRKHLYSNGKNKMGWPSTGFWEDAARGSTWTANANSVAIVIHKVGVRQRFYGGPIKPTRTKALTIPVCAEAYGHTAAEFPEMVIITVHGKSYLALKSPTETHSPAANGLKLMFLLSPGVDQAPDPTVIPSSESFAATAHAALLEAIHD